jgi:predicted RNA binding protein YcfA (HicA-like mRNA interferase family)
MAPSAQRKRRAFDRIAQKRCRSVKFDEVCALLALRGWERIRVAGSHHIYTHPAYEGIVSLPEPHHGSEINRVYCRQALAAITEVEDYAA